MRHTMTLTALTAALLVSTAAYAQTNSVGAKATIEGLPDKGAVSLSGTVDRVVDGDTFVLRDSAGETIDVHTNTELSVNKGDMVSVKGMKKDEIAGIGREIEGATVSVTGKAAAAVQGATDSVNHMAQTETPKEARANTEDKKTAAYDADIDVDANADVDKVANAGEMATRQTRSTVAETRSNTEAKKTAAYDADINVDADADVDRVAEAGEMTAREATTATSATANAVADATDAVVDGTIGALPKEGSVKLSGVVDRVSNDNKFILRDANGETIDVHTASNVSVEPGDQVSVNGNVTSELLGFGRQIEGAQVIEVSAAQ